MLHGITQPRGKITLGIGPCHRVRHVNHTNRHVSVDRLRSGIKPVTGTFQPCTGQVPEKLKDSRVFPLMLAEGFKIDKKIHDRLAVGRRVEPVAVCIGIKRPFGPVAVRKTKGQVIAQFIILE